MTGCGRDAVTQSPAACTSLYAAPVNLAFASAGAPRARDVCKILLCVVCSHESIFTQSNMNTVFALRRTLDSGRSGSCLRHYRGAHSLHICSPRQGNVIVKALPQRASALAKTQQSRPYSLDFRTSGGWITEAELTDSEHVHKGSHDTMAIIHIILFEFKPSVTHAQVEDVCKRMVALQDNCIHPETKQPYVKSFGGGRDTSPEGLQVVVLPPFCHLHLTSYCYSRAASVTASYLNSQTKRTGSIIWRKTPRT